MEARLAATWGLLSPARCRRPPPTSSLARGAVAAPAQGAAPGLACAQLLSCQPTAAPASCPCGPAAEFLQINDLREHLTPQESPFTVDNNAGGGFGAPGLEGHEGGVA